MGISDKISNEAQKVKGKAQEAAGDLTVQSSTIRSCRFMPKTHRLSFRGMIRCVSLVSLVSLVSDLMIND